MQLDQVYDSGEPEDLKTLVSSPKCTHKAVLLTCQIFEEAVPQRHRRG